MYRSTTFKKTLSTPKDLFDTVDSLFQSINFDTTLTSPGVSPSTFPKLNLIETESSFIIKMGLSGWRKEELKIGVKDNTLVVSGDPQLIDDGEVTYLVRELKRSKFSRSVLFKNQSVNFNKIEATYEDGLLTVVVPKSDLTTLDAIQIK